MRGNKGTLPNEKALQEALCLRELYRTIGFSVGDILINYTPDDGAVSIVAKDFVIGVASLESKLTLDDFKQQWAAAYEEWDAKSEVERLRVLYRSNVWFKRDELVAALGEYLNEKAAVAMGCAPVVAQMPS